RVLAMHEKPVVILDPTGVYEPLRDLMQRLTEQGFARHRIWDAIGWTSTVAEAFDLLERSQPRIEFSAGDYAETQLCPPPRLCAFGSGRANLGYRQGVAARRSVRGDE